MVLTKNVLKNFLTGLDQRGYYPEMSDDKVRELFLNDELAWKALAAFLRALRGIVQSTKEMNWRRN